MPKLLVVVVVLHRFVVVQGENVIKEIFPKKVAELNALLEVLALNFKLMHV